jgi:cation:H+ antiporter
MSALYWTFPLLMFASIVIGWGAELTAAWLSAGMALAILAWLQTSPEFAVEATIAWNQDAHLALANLTGSLRLLLGFGWPVIFFIYWLTGGRKSKARTKSITLSESFAVEAAGLTIPVLYFLLIYLKGTWSPLDGIILCAFYGIYFWMLTRERVNCEAPIEAHADSGDEPWVVRKALTLSRRGQIASAVGLFAFGGVALWLTVHPFLEALKTVAASLGVSDFVFIQWIAPIASEFPEKVTAFNWARRPGKVQMAIVNMLSSVTSQWTLLAGLIPILFSLSAGRWYVIEFTPFQKEELLLTIAQTAVAVVMMMDLKITFVEMAGFFVLWALQFFLPAHRHYLLPIYGLWVVAELVPLVLNPRRMKAWIALRKILFSKSA